MAPQVDQELVVPTSTIRVELRGTRQVVADRAEVNLSGTVGEREVDESFELDVGRDGEVGNLRLFIDATPRLWQALEPGDGQWFRGDLTVQLTDVLGVDARGRLEDVGWQFVEELAPAVQFDAPTQLFPNATIEVSGDGVLRPEEGDTVAVIEEGLLDADRGHTVDLDDKVLPVAWTGDRQRAGLRLDPSVIGVHPGKLEATIRFENRFSDGTSIVSPHDSTSFQSSIDPPFVASVSPTAASRGQLVELEGRGFVPPDGGDYGMVLRFEGTLSPADPELDPVTFEGETAAERVPYETVSDEQLVQDVWYRVVDRQLQGLGAIPGVFDGRITPIVYDQYGTVDGLSWEGAFEILPTRQIVYLQYLPAFSVALNRYGLNNVEREIRQRILDVVNRDYQGINIEFVEDPPADFAHYATVEIGGPDPTGGSAFGFDNTFNDQPKDTGNLHLDDYLGGINPETGEEFNNPYGGIFVESFAQFSPTLHPEMGHASDHFDRVFGPFMPELGGDRIRATEWPEGDRVDEIEEAIRVFGNVVGNTVSHEMGHALGLAHFEEDWETPGHRFHNRPEHEPGIMHPGAERSFEQRAELDGEGPSGFNERNRSYLEDILPLQP